MSCPGCEEWKGWDVRKQEVPEQPSELFLPSAGAATSSDKIHLQAVQWSEGGCCSPLFRRPPWSGPLHS